MPSTTAPAGPQRSSLSNPWLLCARPSTPRLPLLVPPGIPGPLARSVPTPSPPGSPGGTPREPRRPGHRPATLRLPHRSGAGRDGVHQPQVRRTARRVPRLRDCGLCRTPGCNARIRHHDHVTRAADKGSLLPPTARASASAATTSRNRPAGPRGSPIRATPASTRSTGSPSTSGCCDPRRFRRPAVAQAASTTHHSSCSSPATSRWPPSNHHRRPCRRPNWARQCQSHLSACGSWSPERAAAANRAGVRSPPRLRARSTGTSPRYAGSMSSARTR